MDMSQPSPSPSPSPSPEEDYYSASTTVIHFPNPLPLLRHPIKSNLAYKTQQSWAQSYLSSKSQLFSQCQSASRIGCSISASNQCKPTLWELIIRKRIDLKERVRCEEAVMTQCFRLANENCLRFAKRKCEKCFKAARIGGDVRVSDMLGHDVDIDEYLRKSGWDIDESIVVD